MKIYAKSRLFTVISPVIVVLALLMAACGGAAPQEVTIPLKLEAGKLTPDLIRVGQNDTVTLQFETEEAGSIHLHGYDLEQEVRPGEVTDFVFVADASGRFKIEFHDSKDEPGDYEEAGHGAEFQLEVLQPGDSFTFEVPHDMDGKTIPYHSRLHPEVSGVVEVSGDAPSAKTVQVEIKDGATEPSQMLVRPGTTIIWTNNSSEMQALASGAYPGAAEESSDTSHDDHDEGEAIDVGFLEVSPR